MSNSVSLPLLARHRLATSPLAGPVKALLSAGGLRGRIAHPELGLLRRESVYVDRAMARLIGPEAVCIDVGAHVGSVTRRLLGLAPRGKVFAVEAMAEKARLIRQRFPQVTVFDCAVSDRDGRATFYENLDQPGFSSLADRRSRGATRAREVEVRRLDDLIAPEQRVDFIKFDVEGFEPEAIGGSRRILARWRPVLLFEAGARNDRDIDDGRYMALIEELSGAMGYDVFAAFDLQFGRAPLSADAFARYRTYPFLAFNYFAIPRPSDRATTAPPDAPPDAPRDTPPDTEPMP